MVAQLVLVQSDPKGLVRVRILPGEFFKEVIKMKTILICVGFGIVFLSVIVVMLRHVNKKLKEAFTPPKPKENKD